ncbi:MAG: lysophospholipid acyltransferase family protein [Pseudomonadota bacterium]
MKTALYWMQAALLRTLLFAVAHLPFARRQVVMGAIVEWVVRLTPPLRARAMANLALIWPEMDEERRRAITFAAARNAGRTLTGIWFNADLARACADLPATGPGLDALREAKSQGRGALVVSGHFGQWETIRHVLKREGMETGAIYRPNNNPYYEPVFRAGIELGGQPIIPKGKSGNREMLRHLRAGGFFAILPDQWVKDGLPLDFLGHQALTSPAAAELARRYDLPLVPAFAPVVGGTPQITFEDPIPAGEPAKMMSAYNARLAAQVEAHPDQWHWFHLRWKAHPSSRSKKRKKKRR